MKIAIAALAAVTLVGCATQSGNMRQGTEQSVISLKDQREAVLTVKEYPALPAGVTVIGKIDASRCHRNTLEAEPSQEALLADVKVAAYARGADGIAQVEYIKESGLLKNCWYIITARATAFRKAP
jgi:hypothetical protein